MAPWVVRHGVSARTRRRGRVERRLCVLRRCVVRRRSATCGRSDGQEAWRAGVVVLRHVRRLARRTERVRCDLRSGEVYVGQCAPATGVVHDAVGVEVAVKVGESLAPPEEEEDE